MSFHARDTEPPERRFGCLEFVDPKLKVDLFPPEDLF
jgi:hypothetical protein